MDTWLLSREEIAAYTGRKIKSLQIRALRDMGVPFRINATGHPVVTRSAIEGVKEAEPVKQAWTPRVLRNA